MALEGLLDESAEATMGGRVAEEHVGSHRPEAAWQPAQDCGEKAIAGGHWVTGEPLMVTQQLVRRVVGCRHPDLAEDRHPHPDERARFAQAGERGERVLLEGLGTEIDGEERGLVGHGDSKWWPR